MTGPQSCLYLGEIMHHRLRPADHRFAYRVFSVFVDLDELPALGRRLRLFSYNRFNLHSFHDRDHGARDGTPLGPWVRAQLRDAGAGCADGRIFVHAFPRVLGYVFNPLTTYWCYAADGRLAAVVCEVKNTFGGQHAYVLQARDGAMVEAEQDKAFYVSPFIAMAARYRFRFHSPGRRLALLIRESDRDGDLLVATHTGRRRPLCDRELLAAALRLPLVTLKVIAGIHWQALRLWLKRVPLEPGPREAA